MTLYLFRYFVSLPFTNVFIYRIREEGEDELDAEDLPCDQLYSGTTFLGSAVEATEPKSMPARAPRNST